MATNNAKTTAKAATPVAKEVEKKTTPVKAETKPAAKAVEKKEPAKKAPAKKAPAKKAAAKKTTTTRAKKAPEVKADVFVQFAGTEYSEKVIMDKVIAAWEAEGKKASAIKKAKLYIKPEDGKAYYVINEGLKTGSTGAVNL